MASFRSLLFRSYWKAEQFIVPGLKSSQYAYYERLRRLVPGKRWLDLGCGHQVFADWMHDEQAEVLQSCREVHGIDLDWAGLKAHPGISNKVFGDLSALPYATGSMEVVSANMVAEHLGEPEKILREIYRVLKPNGSFIFHTPNLYGWVIQAASRVPEFIKKKVIWFFERRKEEDVFPTHYQLNTGQSIRQLAAKTGFASAEIEFVSTSAATVMLGPAVWIELLYLRWIRKPRRAHLRSNIVAVLRKP